MHSRIYIYPYPLRKTIYRVYLENGEYEFSFSFASWMERDYLGGSLTAGKWPFPASRQKGLKELIKKQSKSSVDIQ